MVIGSNVKREQASTKWRRRLAQSCFILLILSLAFSVVFHLLVDVLPFDDAFITFRYVDNIWAGKGLTYNTDERVIGSSTPLYILWLCVLKAVFRAMPLPVLAVRGNALWFLVSALAIVALIRDLSGRPTLALIAGALFAFNLPLLVVSTGGMESFLFVALVFWAAWAVVARRFALAAFLSGISILARPEGVFSVGVCVIVWLLRDRGRSLQFWALLLTPALAWFIFATLYYGTPVYHSIIAKSRPLYPLPALSGFTQLLIYVGEWTGSGEGSRLEMLQIGMSVFFASTGLVMAVYILHAPARRKDGWILPVLFGCYFAFYSISNPMIFPWYIPHVYASLFLSLLLGLPQFGAWIDVWSLRSSKDHSRLIEVEALFTALLLLALAVTVLGPYRQHWIDGESITDSIKEPARLRTVGYREAAEWLNSVAPESATIASPEVGALGYYWHGQILDGCGLVSPAAIPFLPVPSEEREGSAIGAISTGLVQEYKPEFVVTLKIFASKSLFLSNWFLNEYEEIHRTPLPIPVWESENVLIFKRRDVQFQQ